MNIDRVADALATRELIETFASCAMRKDSDIWGSTWAEEGSWKIDSLDQPAAGKSAVIAVFEKLMPNIEFVSMTSFPSELVIEGDRARGKAYSQELIFPRREGRGFWSAVSTTNSRFGAPPGGEWPRRHRSPAMTSRGGSQRRFRSPQPGQAC